MVVRARTTALRVAMLAALCTALSVLVPTAAAANPTSYEVPVGTGTGDEPLTLAATGLDLTLPIVVGLGLLVLGIALVALVTLRGGRQH